MSLTDAAATFAGTQLIRRAKWTWLGYGLVAYAGLRLMKHFGVLEPQADQALRLIDRVAGRAPKQEAAPTRTVDALH